MLPAGVFYSKNDLSCPQCTEIYTYPVQLVCGHNVCKLCLDLFWKWSGRKDCPVCGTESPSRMPPINLELKLSVEKFQAKSPAGTRELCPLHNEKLQVFCNNDEEPICPTCQVSKEHIVHRCCPLEEAAQQKKAEVSAVLESFTKKIRSMTKTKHQWEETKIYIKAQSALIQEEIKQEFQKLHRFLQDEEDLKLKALKHEEETKIQVMSQKIRKIEEDIKTLSVSISFIDIALKAKDLRFLQGYKKTKQSTKCNIQEPESIRNILLNSAKHVGILKYEVWKKMLTVVKYAPVILDPNTAHSNLKLSQELTSVQYSNRQNLPNNPERFTSRMSVLGASGFASGKHSWTVTVGQSKDWYIGVVRESVKRKSTIFLNPDEGFWVIGRCSVSLWAETSPRTRIPVKNKPEIIAVQLDYDRGKVVFINCDDSSVIYTFKDRFTEKIFPYFALGLYEDWRNSIPLTVGAVKVKVALG